MSPLIASPEISSDGRTARVVFNQRFSPLEWHIAKRFGPSFKTDGSANFALLAAVPYAMACGKDLHIKGAVCPILLGNMERLVHNRVAFHSPNFRHIRISADSMMDIEIYEPSKPHIAAYSGGIDSTYAIAKNMMDKTLAMYRPIGASLTISDFGFGEGDALDFKKAMSKGASLGKLFGFENYAIQCNLSKLAKEEWGIKGFSPHVNSHPMFIASCLSLFSGRFAGAIFATDIFYPDENVQLNWSSNSSVHALLSSSGYHLNVFGGEASRSDKIVFLNEKDLLKGVIICAFSKRSEFADNNCGQCKKCRQNIVYCYSLDIDPHQLFAKVPRLDELFAEGFSDFGYIIEAKSLLQHWSSRDHETARLKLWERTRQRQLEKNRRQMNTMRNRIKKMGE